MNIKIGAKIRLLRNKLDITQDRLAEYLGITAQAVSRWESEVCYPDIELLPALADFFNTTLDELMGVDQSKKEAQINKIIGEANKAQYEGKFGEAVAIYRNAVSLYPSSYKLQTYLASAIGCIDNGEKIPAEAANEAINICCRILEDCVDDAVRYQALSIICWVYYRQKNDLEKAMEIAERMPALYNSREYIKLETLQFRMPSEEAECIIFKLISAMLIAFDKQAFAYCNDKQVMLRILTDDLQLLSETLK